MEYNKRSDFDNNRFIHLSEADLIETKFKNASKIDVDKNSVKQTFENNKNILKSKPKQQEDVIITNFRPNKNDINNIPITHNKENKEENSLPKQEKDDILKDLEIKFNDLSSYSSIEKIEDEVLKMHIQIIDIVEFKLRNKEYVPPLLYRTYISSKKIIQNNDDF